MKPTFQFQRGYTGREVTAIHSSADWLGAGLTGWRDHAEPGFIPIGTVEFCEPAFGNHRKDFYPAFLYHMMHREFTWTNLGQLYAPRFVKDASAWKSDFVSGVMPSGYVLPHGKWLVSEVVEFRNEWRYYIADGSLVTTGWYAGDDEDLPAPDCGIDWPKGFSGAVDFGTLNDGRLALVECHAPFACGWYGEDHRDYALWQAIGWEKSDWWKSP